MSAYERYTLVYARYCSGAHAHGSEKESKVKAKT